MIPGLLAWGLWLRAPADVDDGAAAGRPAAPATAPAATRPAAPPQAASALAPASTALAPTTAGVRILALRQDRHGRWLAHLQVGQDPPRLAQTGDVVAHGLRVERIAPGGLTLRRGLQQEQLSFAGPVPAGPAGPQPRPPPAPSVIVSPSGQDSPSSSGVERAIQRASAQAGLGSGH